MTRQNVYVVATVKPWNLSAFRSRTPNLPGRWHLIDRREDLTLEALRELDPRYVFFPHWSWRVPTEVLQAYECVCFHMTDVPFGRGGSPLQNLIARGHKETRVTALRMVEELDAGPVYLKCPLWLEGKAQTIFERLAHIVYDMILQVVETEPEPVPQSEEATYFPRRRPEQSSLPMGGSLEQLYDHIRMLDAETYPRAFIEYGNLRLEFSDAEIVEGAVRATASIAPLPSDP